MYAGKSVKRVDGLDKVTGRAKYTEDLCSEHGLIVKIHHANIAHGFVKKVDIEEALRIEGVVAIFTCFDVPDRPFPTAGHPWSTDPAHQDVADRLLLHKHVRYYGDEVAAVVAENEVAAKQAVRAIQVEYDELPFVLDVQEAMEEGAPQLHDAYPRNILAHSKTTRGDLAKAIEEPGLIKVEGWYDTPSVQHAHIENHICEARMEAGRVIVMSSTQIPHIVRRVVAQALGLPWGKVRIIKPYIGGGFGNKQDALYEPLCAWLSYKLGGRTLRLDVSREETFVNNRVRHAIRFHMTSWLRPNGEFVARQVKSYSDQGAYASHGHGIAAKGLNSFPQLYQCDHFDGDAWTVYTNKPVSGAMRGYGIPQAMFAGEAHIDDIARILGMDALDFRMKYVMKKGYTDAFSHNVNYEDSFRECLLKGCAALDYETKLAAYRNQSGMIRRGVGLAVFWYNTGVWPIALEMSACRIVLNQDGSVQLQLGETEIGQGADTAFAQMCADVLGIRIEDVHVQSTQDTDVTPYGTGAYASRQTYMAGFSIQQTALQLKEKILKHATTYCRMPAFLLDIKDGSIVRISDGQALMSVGEVATEVLYSLEESEHIAAESTYQIKSNAYSFGCSLAEVEVDVALCQVKLLRLINVHDCGSLVNPQLAEAQVHGGMSMAIGYGLTEELKFDPKTGRTLNDNLLDYKLCTFVDHPDLEVYFVEHPEPTQPFGTKALGEPPTCSAAPAIRNAILQATGVAVNQTPMTPHVLFKRFSEEGLFAAQAGKEA